MRPLCIGHRGAPKLAPENTMASFERAFSFPWIGAVELDVHETKDGRAAVIHDDTVERTTKGKGFVSDKTASELKALSVPLLEDVLDLAKKREKLLFVELKLQPRFYPKLSSIVVSLVREKKMQERVVLITFDHRGLVQLKRSAPEIACGALCGQRLHEPARYLRDYLGVEWWLPGTIGEVDSVGFMSATKELDRAAFDQVHAAGLKIGLWTVNYPFQVEGVRSLGADGVISDDPDLLKALA